MNRGWPKVSLQPTVTVTAVTLTADHCTASSYLLHPFHPWQVSTVSANQPGELPKTLFSKPCDRQDAPLCRHAIFPRFHITLPNFVEAQWLVVSFCVCCGGAAAVNSNWSHLLSPSRSDIVQGKPSESRNSIMNFKTDWWWSRAITSCYIIRYLPYGLFKKLLIDRAGLMKINFAELNCVK